MTMDRFAGRHGLDSMYKAGCRCAECRRAAADFKLEQKFTSRSDPLTPNPGAVVAARIREVFADEDAARMAHLDELIRSKGTCRYCGTRLSDESLDKHPGVCGSLPCLRAARREVIATLPPGVVKRTPGKADRYKEAKARFGRTRRKGEPCHSCGSRSTRHRTGCQGSWAEKDQRKAVA